MPNRLYQYIGEVEPVLVPPPDFNWFQPPPERPRRHPPRPVGGLSWHTATPLDDYDWEPLTNQPYLRHKRRQAAGESARVELPRTGLVEFTWLPAVNQPLFQHKRRQAAGAIWNTETPVPVMPGPDEWAPLLSQPYPSRYLLTAALNLTWVLVVIPPTPRRIFIRGEVGSISVRGEVQTIAIRGERKETRLMRGDIDGS
ncbi:hypothetical protein LCGC14_0587970 [marine sediment metagenome]|uniref:Uncharacterized protein n=1 Tax=marine sediment metagenome TaxID=412755 RepID=A0A0F9RJI2_9ZZZZ